MKLKSFMPTICPECNSKLKLDFGQNEDTIKLLCKNIDCKGTSIKKIQKGIKVLEIRGLGPSTIEKLYLSGIKNSYDLFDIDILNEENLCNYEFKSGRALDKVIDAVKNVKSIKIDKAILSLQIIVDKDNSDGFISIGKSLSEQIGKMISGVDYDFEGLSLQIREQIQDKNSKLYTNLLSDIEKFRDHGIEIELFKKPIKKTITKKIKKQVTMIGDPSSIGLTSEDLLSKLEWEIVDIESSDMLIVENKNINNDLVEYAKDNNIKIMTYKQIKILFL